MLLGVTLCVCLCVRISLGGEGNALHLVLCSFHCLVLEKFLPLIDPISWVEKGTNAEVRLHKVEETGVF